MPASAPLDELMAPLRRRWRALPPGRQQLLGLAAVVLALLLAWTVAVQPALATLRQAAAEADRLDAELQSMQRLALEARELQRAPTLPAAQATAALQAATERLGPTARLALQGERAVLTVNEVGTSALNNWLLEVRSGARAQPVEANLTRGTQGYSGTVVVLLGGGA
jgi:general secretion pathway protein M